MKSLFTRKHFGRKLLGSKPLRINYQTSRLKEHTQSHARVSRPMIMEESITVSYYNHIYYRCGSTRMLLLGRNITFEFRGNPSLSRYDIEIGTTR